ncbi:MAG: HpcH/HpaI aldolase/citrate lyase family protein [Steroidobacteraceae bacterium]
MRLRSLLFVPGDRPDQMTKALVAGADALILDLEDSVAPQRKAQARIDVAAFLNRDARPMPMFVRVNPLRSGFTDQDLAAVAVARPDGVVFPKAEGAASIIELARRMNAKGMSATRILPIATETPAAIFRMGEYGAVAERLVGVTWGAEDLSTAVGATSAREPSGSFTAPYEMVRALTLFAAHAAQVPAIETVYPAFRDHAGLSHYAERGARDGFTGMMAIHPSQVKIINAAFTPSAQIVDRSRRIVAEFNKHPDAGVVSIDGGMFDAPHLKQAQRILAQADAADASDPK